MSTGLGFIRTFFLIFGFVALFVGAFIIFNMFNIVVSQRTRELALFRALGASRRQVLTSVLTESIAVGLIGSILGIGLGVLLAFALKALLAAFGLKLPPTALAIETRTIVVSLIVGIGVTVAAAWAPARRASRVAPIEALRESSRRAHRSAGGSSSAGSCWSSASQRSPPRCSAARATPAGWSGLARR